MTQFEFNQGMDRLRQVYGEVAYPSERSSIIAEKVCSLEAREWGAIIKKIIGENRYAPMADKIREYAEPFLKRHHEAEKAHFQRLLSERRAKGQFCPKCGDSGDVSAWRRNTFYRYHFRCPEEQCVAARIHCSPRDAVWSSDYEHDFVPVFYNEDPDAKLKEASSKKIEEVEKRARTGFGNTEPVEMIERMMGDQEYREEVLRPMEI